MDCREPFFENDLGEYTDMKFLQKDDDFWREYDERLKELDALMKEREEASRKKGDRDAAR